MTTGTALDGIDVAFSLEECITPHLQIGALTRVLDCTRSPDSFSISAAAGKRYAHGHALALCDIRTTAHGDLSRRVWNGGDRRALIDPFKSGRWLTRATADTCTPSTRHAGVWETVNDYSNGLQEFHQVPLLIVRQTQSQERIVMLDDVPKRGGATVVEIRACCQSARSGVVRYCFVVVRAA
jgi:hypothetical protein